MDNYLADPPVFIPPRSYLDLLDYGVGLYFMNFIHLDRLRLIDRRPLGGGSCFAVLNGFGASFMRYVDSILTIIARRQQQQQHQQQAAARRTPRLMSEAEIKS